VVNKVYKLKGYQMNLVFFSIKTKGMYNFARRIVTVFTRFGFTETPTRRALRTVIDLLREYQASPTFFIPAVVLNRHRALMTEIAGDGAEIGIHGHVHNDYRTLSSREQYHQTEKAIQVFRKTNMAFQGFRNPYLGWTEESLEVFSKLGFTYDSNDAVLHDVVNLKDFSPLLQSGYAKSLELFQAVSCSAYALRPYFAGQILRIPTSIPDDEMLLDRLRVTNVQAGAVWSSIMQRVYDLGGLYTLNLHPERATLCKPALQALLASSRQQALPVWVTSLKDVATWWKERNQFRWHITSHSADRWLVEAKCTARATVVAHNVIVEEATTNPWFKDDLQVEAQTFTVQSTHCPCIGVSPNSPQEIDAFLYEQGYPFVRCSPEDAQYYAYYLDIPEGLGVTHDEQLQRKSKLVNHVETSDAPLVYFGCWPNGRRAALSITGDIDSITVQDFFLRIIEVYKLKIL
jgi:peptidoglycan/xylan/chitin deacetylase (PgdA/CDA1 family)